MLCLQELCVHTETRNISELHIIDFNAKSISPRAMQRDLHDQCIFFGIIPTEETRGKLKSQFLPTGLFQHLQQNISLSPLRNISRVRHYDRWWSTGV